MGFARIAIVGSEVPALLLALYLQKENLQVVLLSTTPKQHHEGVSFGHSLCRMLQDFKLWDDIDEMLFKIAP